MAKPQRKRFDASSLRHIAGPEEFQDAREPEVGLGDLVRLNSGGPIMLVVDVDGDVVTTAWKCSGLVVEHQWQRPCIHRVRDGW